MRLRTYIHALLAAGAAALIGYTYHTYAPGVRMALTLGEASDPAYRETEKLVSSRNNENFEAFVFRTGTADKLPVILIPGILLTGANDARVKQVAKALASEGHEVFVPHLPSVDLVGSTLGTSCNRKNARIQSAAALLDELSKQRPNYKKFSLVTFSSGAEEAMELSAKPAYRQKIHSLHFIGGYRGSADILTYYLTGYFEDKDGWKKAAPESFFARQNMARKALTFGVLNNFMEPELAKKVVDAAVNRNSQLIDTRKLGESDRRYVEMLTEPDAKKLKESLSSEASSNKMSEYLKCWNRDGLVPGNITDIPVSALTGPNDAIVPEMAVYKLVAPFSKKQVFSSGLMRHDLPGPGNKKGVIEKLKDGWPVAMFMRSIAEPD